MNNTLILRFRDLDETPTIQAHDSIIRGPSKATWWGWWKKESEPYDAAIFERLESAMQQQGGTLPIGLINRQTDGRYIATCASVSFTPNGTPFRSPQPQMTPDYYRGASFDDYRGASFPAWFLLRNIAQITNEEWDALFGGVPLGEPTLIEVPLGDTRRAREILNELERPIRSELRVPTILHITDVHFGEDFAFPLRHRTSPTLRQTLDEQILEGLDQAGIDNIGIVVISGDITTKGDPNGFAEARHFLTRLTDGLKLPVQNVVIVPGNHDIWLDSTKVDRSFSNEQHFRDFIQLVYNSDSLQLNRLYEFRSSKSDNDILVLALNSVRPRSEATKEYGYVGRDLYGPLLKELVRLRERRANGQSSAYAVAVLHHHVLPPPLVEEPEEKRPVSLTLDAGELMTDLSMAGVDMVLHGHQHLPFVGSTSRAQSSQAGWNVGNSVHVVGGGSCGVRGDRLYPAMRYNTIGVYSFQRPIINVKMFEFAPGTAMSIYMDLNLTSQ